jgi:hypothetical protein
MFMGQFDEAAGKLARRCRLWTNRHPQGLGFTAGGSLKMLTGDTPARRIRGCARDLSRLGAESAAVIDPDESRGRDVVTG